jgi:hypothetical protein
MASPASTSVRRRILHEPHDRASRVAAPREPLRRTRRPEHAAARRRGSPPGVDGSRAAPRRLRRPRANRRGPPTISSPKGEDPAQ